MNPHLTLRVLAFINVGIGALIAVGTLTSAIGAFLAERKDPIWSLTALLAFVGLIAGSLIHAGWIHLKRPSQKSALNLAINSSVVLWLIVGAVLGEVADQQPRGIGYGPYHTVATIIIAYLGYRFFLKPVALRAFPAGAVLAGESGGSANSPRGAPPTAADA